jgi:ribosomal-protein-alanine N-acetyltransferase
LGTPFWRIKVQEKLNTILKTERLILRPLEFDDVDVLWREMSDPEISRYMAWESPVDKPQTEEFVRAEIRRLESGKGVTWGIFKEGEFCGIASLIAIIWSHRALIYKKAELAYWLAKRYQKQGIMIEALQQIMEFGFREFGLHKICVSHFVPNVSSEKLINRLGFRYIGEQVEEYQKNGIWYNQKNYELLEKEFLN